ncbi:MAG: hypothetical protein OXG24_07750 [Gammaproteobacteria bacterium]|nr:hypothetical protein [Gammaproteobacteria bacterium]
MDFVTANETELEIITPGVSFNDAGFRNETALSSVRILPIAH